MPSPTDSLAHLREPRLSLCGSGEDSVPAVCGVSPQTALNWRDRGLDGRKLPTFNVGRLCFVLTRDLAAFLNPDDAEDRRPAEPAKASPAGDRANAALDRVRW